jgi:hypothetical protein
VESLLVRAAVAVAAFLLAGAAVRLVVGIAPVNVASVAALAWMAGCLVTLAWALLRVVRDLGEHELRA